jgi:uncharacterized OB-fold protein
VTVERNFNVVFENRLDYPHFEGLGKGQVRIPRCDKCQHWTWPAEWRCGECGSWDFHWETVENPEGVIYAWTRTHYSFSDTFKDMLPFVSVLVELPNAGKKRLVGILVGDTTGVKIGARVKPEFQKPSERTHNLPALWWRLADAAK